MRLLVWGCQETAQELLVTPSVSSRSRISTHNNCRCESLLGFIHTETTLDNFNYDYYAAGVVDLHVKASLDEGLLCLCDDLSVSIHLSHLFSFASSKYLTISFENIRWIIIKTES